MTPRLLRPFSELSTTGMLWFINRSVFHPLGFALAVQKEADGTVTGWTMQGSGDECWTFTNDADDEEFAKAHTFLRSLRDS